MEKEIGMHFIADLCECKSLPSRAELEKAMNEAIEIAQMNPIGELIGEVLEGDKAGDSKIILFVPLEESHFSVHVFVPLNYVAVDLFTCGDNDAARKAFLYFCRTLQPDEELSTVLEIPRVVRKETK